LEVEKTLLEQKIANQFPHHKIIRTTWSLYKINNLSEQSELSNFEITFRVKVSEGGESFSITSSKEIGSVLISDKSSLAKVGNRWYLANNAWEGQLVKE